MDRRRPLAVWEHKAQASAQGRRSGCPVRKPVGPQVCAQGRLMGQVLAASQRAQDVPSQDSESIWVGSLSTASPSAKVPPPFGGLKPSVFTQALLCKARRPVPLSPRPPLPSTSPPHRLHHPPACSPDALLLLPPVSGQGTPLRSLSSDGRGGEGHVLTRREPLEHFAVGAEVGDLLKSSS